MQINRPSHQGEYDWRLIGWHWDYNIDDGKDIYKDAYKAAEKFANSSPIIKQWDTGDRIVFDALCKYNKGINTNLYSDTGEIKNWQDQNSKPVIGFRYACNWTPNKVDDNSVDTLWTIPEKNSNRWLTPYSVEYHIVHQDWPK
jgi:hypothetical protein